MLIKKSLKYFTKRFVILVNFIDAHVLQGRIKTVINRWLLKHTSKYPDDNHWFLLNGRPNTIASLEVKYSLDFIISTRDLLLMQYASPYIRPNYLRYDIPFAYLQKKSVIYDSEKIVVDQDLGIIQGLHRFVDDLRHNKEFVKVNVNYIDEWDKKKLFDIYNIQYRENIDVSKQTNCDNELKKILENCIYPFVLVIWPSSENVWGEIENELTRMVGNGFKILENKIIHYSKNELLGFMDACYKYAGIPSETLTSKKNVVIEGCVNKSSEYPVKIITFKVDNPYYIVDSQTGQPFSSFQKDLKMNIRSRYWNKVPNYAYDNIIHGTDNYIQSKLLIELLKIDTEISSLYKLLEDQKCNYAIIKRSPKAQPEINDPIVNNKIIFNSDIDILTSDEDIQKVVDLVKTFASQHFMGDWVRIEEEKVHFNHGEKYNRFLWVRLKDFNVVLFHIQSRLYGLTPQFLSECLENRRKDNLQYVIDMPKYEVYLRLADLLKHPEKTHHVNYVRLYSNLITTEGLCRAFGNNHVKEIQNKLKEYIG